MMQKKTIYNKPDITSALVISTQHGDVSAFELLVRSHLRAAYLVALAFVGRPSDAEDVAQDAFVNAFEQIDTCRDPARFSGWLIQIVRNQARNWIQRRRHREGPEGHDSQRNISGDMSETAMYRMQLLKALQYVTQLQREIVMLHDLEGWTHQEISQALSISNSSSRWHLFYARRALREHLDRPTAGHKN